MLGFKNVVSWSFSFSKLYTWPWSELWRGGNLKKKVSQDCESRRAFCKEQWMLTSMVACHIYGLGVSDWAVKYRALLSNLFYLRNKDFLVLLSNRENCRGDRFKQIWLNLRLEEVYKCVSIPEKLHISSVKLLSHHFTEMYPSKSWFLQPSSHPLVSSTPRYDGFLPGFVSLTIALPHTHHLLRFIMRRREGWCHLFLSGYGWVPPFSHCW